MNRIACAAVLLCATAAPAQWTIQDAHTTADLRGIHALGNGVAWASGTEGTVLRTTKDGKDWQRCATPPDADHLDFRGIQAFDASTAIVMSSGKGPLSRLYKTTDACQTWKLVLTNPDPEGFWDAIQFADRKHGFLLGDPVQRAPDRTPFAEFRSIDGGQTWNEVDEAHWIQPPNRDAAIFAASNSSMLIRNGASIFVTGGSRVNLYNRSVTSGYSVTGPNPGTGTRPYIVIRLPMGTDAASSGAFSIALSEKTGVGVVVGGDYTTPNEASYTAVYSTDVSFFHWNKAETFPHGFRSAVSYDVTTKTWITVGPNGTDISTDDGRNWRPLRPSSTEAPDADQHWNALSLPFVVGPHGRIGKLNPQALSTGH